MPTHSRRDTKNNEEDPIALLAAALGTTNVTDLKLMLAMSQEEDEEEEDHSNNDDTLNLRRNASDIRRMAWGLSSSSSPLPSQFHLSSAPWSCPP